MPLDDYRSRRDFGRTPEPHGRPRRTPGPGRRFVVQKHAARRLHFDFRLELDGVLKSWAIPKGPSLNPGERRLAVHVEDHPLEYGDFEGVIPEGEYGAGAVLLWDEGRWEPEGDPHAAYRVGQLKFTLHGHRLHGRWALVRTGPRREARSDWLLIKKDDSFADPGFTGWSEETSTATGRTLDQVAAPDGARPSEPENPATVMPAFLAPQLARPEAIPPEGGKWLHEIKFDGYRVLTRIEGGTVTLFSRGGKDWTGRLGALADALARLPLQSAWLDGEISVLLPDGRTSFQALQEALAEGRDTDIVYFLFDLPLLNGTDLRETPLAERKKALRRLLETAGDPLHYTDHLQGQGGAFFRQACRLDLEGIISKRADAPYRSTRNRDWRKVKCQRRQEFVVGGFSDPSGARPGLGALLLGLYQEDALRYVGRVGTGFSESVLRSLRRQLEALEVKEPPFAVATPRKTPGLHWVRPERVAEVRFTEWTREGVLRQPVFLGLREDKPAREVRLEKPALRRNAASNRIAGVRLTHPDRVLYPEQGLTKRRLAEYYTAVADWVLPDLVNRPLTLLRCPEGHHKGCFFQKHANGRLPGPVRTIDIPEKGQGEPYLYIADLAGLIGLVQMGVLEIHTWGSRVDRPESPDRLVFDLDPDEGLPWDAVIDAACTLRELLSRLGLHGFVRTTGGKGLHVAVPLVPHHGWDEVKAFAKSVAVALVREAPQRYTASPVKRSRKGRLFIDYLRNGRGATAITNYGTRARPHAPVATPIAWEELNAGRGPDSWNVDSLPQRLANLTRDPWEGYAESGQQLPVTAARHPTRGDPP